MSNKRCESCFVTHTPDDCAVGKLRDQGAELRSLLSQETKRADEAEKAVAWAKGQADLLKCIPVSGPCHTAIAKGDCACAERCQKYEHNDRLKSLRGYLKAAVRRGREEKP